MSRRTTSILAIFVLTIVLLAAIAIAQNPKNQPGTLAHNVFGVVETGIMTAGGDCPHRYWLKVESGGPSATRVALEPESKLKPEYVDQRVKISGKWDTCHGTENDFLVLKVDTISPGK